MKHKWCIWVLIAVCAGVLGCYDADGSVADSDVEVRQTDDAPDPAGEDSGLIIPEDALIAFSFQLQGERSTKWEKSTHRNIAAVAAAKLGLSSSRIAIIEAAADMPDVYQSGLENGFNQQWSHAFMYNTLGWWYWGDADDDFHDNINGDSGEAESPEGYNGKWAGYYYTQGRQDLGDWYLGYALHYIADVSLCLHTSFPDVDKALHHFDFEKWVENNWSAGHNFAVHVNSVPVSTYYPVTDLKATARAAAKKSCCSLSSNPKKAWSAYSASGFPTAAGSGNTDAVYYTKLMLTEAVRYTGGTITYTLNRYGQ